MTTIKNHWRFLGVLALALVGVGALLWSRAEARMSFFGFFMLEEPAYTPMSPVERDAVLTVLSDLTLDRDALTALNLSGSQAETLLSTARTWRQNNASTLASQNNAIHEKRHAAREIEKAIAMGPFDPNRETQLGTARQELTNAEAAYRSTLSSLESSLSASLSASQRATWTAVKSGWGQQMPLRMLDLTDQQRIAVSDAFHRYQRQHSAASSDQERSSAVTTWTSALDSILTSEQKTVVQSYTSNFAGASAAVADAYAAVLPVQEQVAQAP